MELAGWLLSARKLKSLTIRQLAEITGIAISTLSRVETGRVQPTMHTVARICDGLELTLEDLLRMAGVSSEGIHDWARNGRAVDLPNVPALADISDFLKLYIDDSAQGFRLLVDMLMRALTRFQYGHLRDTNMSETEPVRKPLVKLESKVIWQIFPGPFPREIELSYPHISSEALLEIYRAGGVLTWRDVAYYLYIIRVERTETLSRFEEISGIPDSSMSRFESGNLENVKVRDVLRLDTSLGANGDVAGLFWMATKYHMDLMQLTDQYASRNPAGNLSSNDLLRVADVLVVLLRWLHVQFPEDRSWLTDIRQVIRVEGNHS